MKKFLVELMNRFNNHFITQSIEWYDVDGLDESIFFLIFFLEKTAFDLLVFGSLQRDSG